MPIPPMNASKEEIAKLGWKKSTIWEWISVEGGKIIYRKMRFVVNKIGIHGICTTCGSGEYVYLITMPTGVRKTCVMCGVT